MSTAKMILEYWVGWQLLDGVRGYLSGVVYRSWALYLERRFPALSERMRNDG